MSKTSALAQLTTQPAYLRYYSLGKVAVMWGAVNIPNNAYDRAPGAVGVSLPKHVVSRGSIIQWCEHTNAQVKSFGPFLFIARG
jgi:hypothetical protein